MLLNEFENSEQASQLDQFVQAADAGHSEQLVQVEGLHQVVERHDGDQVHSEPPTQVPLRDRFSINYGLEVFVVESGVEDDQDVEEEQHVDDGLHDDPLHLLFLVLLQKGQAQRSDDAGENQHQDDEDVPSLDEVVVGHEQRCFNWLLLVFFESLSRYFQNGVFVDVDSSQLVQGFVLLVRLSFSVYGGVRLQFWVGHDVRFACCTHQFGDFGHLGIVSTGGCAFDQDSLLR